MMLDKISTTTNNTTSWRDFLFIILVGAGLGVLGGFVNEMLSSLIGAVLLLALFGAYNNVLDNNRVVMSGLLAGGVAGIIVGQVGMLLGGIPDTINQAALFGLIRGMLLGAVIGLLTRARPDAGDYFHVSLFLILGSIVVGAFLGAGVGLIAGLALGIVGLGWLGVLLAVLLGLTVGGYLGSYFQSRRAIYSGALIFGAIALLGTLSGGALKGLSIGLLAGALTPMLVVALIGFLGGLSSRGLQAGFLEAFEAPEEMIQQGAVPFLAPAILVGTVVGAASSGTGGMLALAVTLAIMGMALGIFSEIERRPTNLLTIQRLIEMVMLGSDRWPIAEMGQRVRGGNRRTAVAGALIGMFLALVGAGIGILIGQQLALWFQTVV